jgi:hypothetical protein
MFLFQVELVERFRHHHHKDQNTLHSLENLQNFTGYNHPPFYEVVQTFSGRNCKDPRDKIYSLFSMAKSPKFDNYTTDHGATTIDCYTEAFKLMLVETGNDYRRMMGSARGQEDYK